MKNIQALVAIILFGNCSSIYSQDWIKDTCELKGPVHHLVYKSKTYHTPDYFDWEEYTYEYNQQGYMIRHNRSSSWAGDDFNAYYRVFDETGVLRQIDYDLQEGDTTSRTEYIYKKGKIVKTIYYTWGKYWNTTVYSYNEQGLLSGRVCTTADGWVHPETFRYDTNGRKIYYDDISSTSKKVKYWTYDNDGFLIEEKFLDSNMAKRTTHYMGDDDKVDSTLTEDYSKSAYTQDSYIYKFSYNESGQLIEKVETKLDGKLTSKSAYTYNQYGDVETRLYYVAQSDKTYSFTYEYEYDQYENRTSKTTKVDGKLYQEETQTITYY